MMKFRTEITLPPFPPEARIGYANHLLALGSCFADTVGERLRRARFACTVNPSGVLFNPASMARAIEAFASQQAVTPEELRFAPETGLWFHFGFHGSFSSCDRNAALEAMNRALQRGTEALHRADRLLLTFGTAWVYEHAGEIVANCHRRPAAEFVRRRLSVEEIVTTYERLLQGPLSGREIILTVSPVRHLGDGLAGNCTSKAVLRLAAEELSERHTNVHYFPAYEIVTDDLRDYRFYADDLIHPAPQAVEYIWEHFAEAVLDERARRLAPAAARIVAAAAHRPLHPDSQTYRDFCLKQLTAIATMPEINFSKEAAYFAHHVR